MESDYLLTRRDATSAFADNLTMLESVLCFCDTIIKKRSFLSDVMEEFMEVTIMNNLLQFLVAYILYSRIDTQKHTHELHKSSENRKYMMEKSFH